MQGGVSGLVDGRYQTIKRLASGGMGEVYLVRHMHLQELRVVKVLRSDLAEDPAAAQRFQQEARTAIQIKHPNVAILYDYAQLPDGRYYMIWEHIEGTDIAAWVQQKGPFPPDLGVELGIQALRGLDAIHSAGVIHRDVSPDNILVTRDNKDRPRVKIIDLGLAKTVGANLGLTQAGTFLGKFKYCSPEQAGYKKVQLDARSDLYSMGLVLYEMLCGAPPFESETLHGFVLKRLSEDPLPLQGRVEGLEIHPSLEQVVMKALEREREDRWESAIEFIEALAEVGKELGREDERGANDSPPPPAEAPKRPRPKPRVSVQGERSSSQLSREERMELLARINRAASKVQETSKSVRVAESALKEGRFEEARTMLGRLEKSSPGLKGLDRLRTKLSEAEGISKRRQQVVQAEQMLEKYLLDRQQTLAQLALETLLEIYPNHPQKEEYEARVAQLGDEAASRKEAEQALSEGRKALARGDVGGARSHLGRLEKLDDGGELVGALAEELERAEKQQNEQGLVDQSRARLEQLLRAKDPVGAASELDRLSGFKTVARVTVDFYRDQILEQGGQAAFDPKAREIEGRFRETLNDGDWVNAREMVLELEKAFPRSPRPAQLFAEVAEREELSRKEDALQQGLQQFDTFLADGRLGEAEVALRILRQIGPERSEVLRAISRFEGLKQG